MENILKDVMRRQESVSVCLDTLDKRVKKVLELFKAILKKLDIIML